MARFIVRHLEDDVKARLKRRRPVPKLGSRIAARFARAGLTANLPELHGQQPRSADVAN